MVEETTNDSALLSGNQGKSVSDEMAENEEIFLT